RMVVPYQIWMLQRLNTAMQATDSKGWHNWVSQFTHGAELKNLNETLIGAAIEKRGGLLYSVNN
ncbi:MAG: hypothetical protein VW831_17270, partial [Gammaproteobacteria bacterium]